LPIDSEFTRQCNCIASGENQTEESAGLAASGRGMPNPRVPSV
jgi:hypothetical protein